MSLASIKGGAKVATEGHKREAQSIDTASGEVHLKIGFDGGEKCIPGGVT